MKKDFHVTLAGRAERYLNIFEDYRDIFVTNDIITDETDLLFLTGGTDVGPNLYGKIRNKKTDYPDVARDLKEKNLVETAIKKNIPIIGVCRGSQFLTVMAGGELIQHCDNHAIYGTHSILTNDDREFDITSTHHQMMYPFNLNKEDYEIVAKSKYNRSSLYEFEISLNNKDDMPDDFVEPEIVYYPKINALAIQGHPEFLVGDPEHKPLIDYINELVETKLLKNEMRKLDNKPTV